MAHQPAYPLKKGKADVINIHRQPVYPELTIGYQAQLSVTLTREMVLTYAKLVGDENPIHVDPVAGEQSIFGTNIVHGMLTGSFFGPIVVNQLIGPGAIYLKQSLEFQAPVPVGKAITAQVTVQEIKEKPGKTIYVLQTECFLENGTRVINGEAVLMLPTKE